MSAPNEGPWGGAGLDTRWASQPGECESPLKWNSDQTVWRRMERRRGDLPRSVTIGTCVLNAVLILTVLVGLGVIMKGCTEFGSPFIAERGAKGQAR